jgi:GntR family transcriptional repressor for pyruvate dehydrogenase complex
MTHDLEQGSVDLVQGGPTLRAPLTPVRTRKASDILADELRERIVAGEYEIGEMLPPERTLSETCEVSRATVREALRILEVQQLVRIRPGRGGGAMVRHPSPELVADSMDMMIRSRSMGLNDLLEARHAIEPASARLAALNRDDADLTVLEQANADLVSAINDSHVKYNQANIEWHTAVVHASHNVVLVSVMDALSRSIYRSTDMEAVLTRAVREETAASHLKITEAIRKRNGEAAARRMAGHVTSAAEVLRSRLS